MMDNSAMMTTDSQETGVQKTVCSRLSSIAYKEKE